MELDEQDPNQPTPTLRLPSWDQRLHELVGRMCFFREPPSVAALVRVLEVKRGAEMIEATFIVLATVPCAAALDVGETCTVSTSTEGWNQLWLIWPLVEGTVADAISEVEHARPSLRGRWRIK